MEVGCAVSGCWRLVAHGVEGEVEDEFEAEELDVKEKQGRSTA